MKHLLMALPAVLMAVSVCLGVLAFIGWLLKPLALLALGVLLITA
ncbi:hypothetical protein [Bifidobacterium favimelis]|uniref:Uncharacterized protein n=1 Tax=Bifidobacterium favimelis TaxID=3122979 RepID=A0ABU8ZP81_9BIFI